MDEIIGAIIGAILGGFFSWNIANGESGKDIKLLKDQLIEAKDAKRKETQRLKSELDSTISDLNSANSEINRLSRFENKYESVKRKLQKSAVVKEYTQPVILVGPRAVGKTSLLAQWHAPWNHSKLNPTQTHKSSVVPIHDFKRKNVEKHFADPDILTDVHIHLKLKVHDFPGELSAQKKIIQEAKAETAFLRKSTGKSLGIVLICMFNAEEASKGLSQSTINYYNGELFVNLRNLVAHNEVGIERLILVFNKFDLLKNLNKNKNNKTLLRQCISVYEPIISLLNGICNSEKVCEVITILSREEMSFNNQGAMIVLGESAREFVKAMAGTRAVNKIIQEDASNNVAPLFS